MFLIAVVVVLCIFAGIWIYGRWNFGTLEKMGIPVVEYKHPLLGHIEELYQNSGGPQDVQWMRKYGSIFGIYEGRCPQIYICVPELVRLICVKDSEFFNDKRNLDFGDPILNEMPDFLPYEKWKLVRSMTGPAFSAAKLKMMNLPMRESTTDFVADIKEKIKQSGKGVYENVAIDLAIREMLTDLISRSFFSIQIDKKGSSKNEFARIVDEALAPSQENYRPTLQMWSHTFPIIRKFSQGLFLNPVTVQNFVTIFKQLLDARRKTGQKYNDVIDLILEWFDKLDTPEYKKAQISELTLFCQALVFFMAAQDQLSMMMSAVIHHMVLDENLEKKIYEEVDRVFAKNNGKIDHESINQLQLLNSCLSESLRLYSVFHRTERVCTKDWKNEEYNLHIKKGTVVQFPIWAINRNKEYIENPDEFDSERFLPENKDKINLYASTAFGHGPRNCTGKRFALESMPIILAYLLKELKFIKRKDTKLNFTPGGLMITLHDPVYVDIAKRN